jgi:amino acid adenylation domain-containing protein
LSVAQLGPTAGQPLEGFSLSPQQRRLWRLGEAAAGGRQALAAYGAILVQGALDAARLRLAVSRVVDRHEILRTTFGCLAGMTLPVQRIAAPGELPPEWLAPEALPAAPRAEGAAAAPGLIAAMPAAAGEAGRLLAAWAEHLAGARPESAETGSPLRLCLVPIAAQPATHLLLVALPAMCADAASLAELAAEIDRAYAAVPGHGCGGGPAGGDPPAELAAGEAAPLLYADFAPLQYADFAAWQDEVLAAAPAAGWIDEGAAAEELPALLAPAMPGELPDGPAGARSAPFAPAARAVLATPAEAAGAAAAMSALARAAGVETAAVLLACWQLLLRRRGGPRRFALGVRRAGRDFDELAGLLGPVASYVPVVCDLDDSARFGELLHAAAAALARASERKDSFSWEALGGRLGRREEDLYPAWAFAWGASLPAGQAPASAPTRFSLAAAEVVSERFHLELEGTASDVPDSPRLALALRYDGSRIAPAMAGDLAAGLRALLAALVALGPAAADLPAGELPVLTPAEQAALLAGPSRACFPGAGSRLDQLVAAQVARTPDRVAVSGDAADGEAAILTYAELARRAAGLARRLAALGAGPERRIALLLPRSPEMVWALLGILESGAAYVPLDPDHPVERLRWMLADVRPELLLTTAPLVATAASLAAGALAVVTVEGPPAPEGVPVDAPRADSLAYVIHTSGSSGKPKGVAVPHQAILNRLLWMQERFPLGAGDRVLQKTPYTFDASIWEVFSPLLSGAAVVLARPRGGQDTAYLAGAVARHGITTLQLVPSLLGQFLEEPGVAAAAASLRRLFCGGEELAPALAGRAADLLAAELCNLYGPTEAAIDASFWACPRQGALAAVPIGGPLPNIELALVNSRLAAVPPGVPGELLIGGLGLARGYLGRPDLTAERFVPHPFSAMPGARLYRTGDLARRPPGEPGGELEYLGRIDRQVKLRGVRIELREVEALLASHPEVRQCAAMLRRPGADRVLVAYVTGPAAAAAGPTGLPAPAPALRAWLADRLPSAMVPAAVVALPALPLTPAGKLDWRALPDPAATPAPQADATAAAGRAPRTPTEQLLAEIWADVLGRERVETGEDFFALGGHSLAATRVASKVRKAFDVELRVQTLFGAPTVSALAREVDAALLADRGLAAPPFEPASRRPAGGELPLSFAQQRLWFLEQLRPGTALYNVADAVSFRGALDRGALAGALSAVVRRHEALRTSFPSRRGTPRQAVHPPAPVPAPLVDLGGLPAPQRAAERARHMAGERDRPFDLTNGPLLRVLLVRLRPDEHLALFTAHHIVTDAWSSGILLRELAALYRAALAGRPAPLPEPACQYADFALWQRRWLQGEALATQLAYWRRQLAGAPPLLALPTDRPRPTVPSFAGVTRPVLLPAVLADGLRGLSRRHGATLFMTLLAAWQVLLRGKLPPEARDDVVVGTDIANRNRAETEGVIGFFINQLAVRTDLSGDPSFAELLARVRATLLDAYAHQDVPFELVVDALALPRNLNHHPLFQVKLFLENTPASSFELPGLAITPLEVEVRVAKLDLTLALWERPEGLLGWLNWSADLFDAAPMARWARHLTSLATAIVERPEARLSELEARITDLISEERTMEKRELRDVGFKKWKAIQPRAVALPEAEVVERGSLAPGSTLPLVIRPLVPDLDLADWAAANAAELEADLLRHGAVLFRGFGIDSPEAFEGFARTLCPDLFNENGEHPRESVTGSVYTPVFYPPDQRLLWHNENSFNWSWPRKIFFCCARPADHGGETPIVDSRRVYAELDPEVRERFESRGVLYQRNYTEGVGLPWQTVFRAETRDEVERQCRGSRVKVDWRDGGRLRTRAVRPAVARHPESGEMSWFNQAQHWHVSCLDPATRQSLAALFADADLPRQCYYGDGLPIADSEMQAVLATYERLEVSFPWQRGDVLMLDNLLTAHGRNPFSGQRKILVAMGQMTNYGEL